MELGRAKLPRTGLNALYQAIHPIYGIAWTDGKQVTLIPLHFHSKEWRFGDSILIGQFQHVQALYWNACYSADLPALLAVQHKKHVSVWQLIHKVLGKNKLMVFQTCEIAEPFQLLPQGCVWHPKRDILSVFTKRDASVLYAVRLDNSKVKADIKSSGLIHCACWTKDGNRLVIAISSSLHSYIWDEDKKTLNACTFCPIFDVGGYICAIEATLDFQIAVSTEFPPDVNGLNAGITSELPISSEMDFMSTGSSQSTLMLGDEEYSMDSRRKSFDSDKSVAVHSVASSSSGPIDLTSILANHRKLDRNRIPLRRKVSSSGSGQYSSQLILITFEGKITTTRKVSIPGILVPDIIAFDLSAQMVAVASNTCNIILVYSTTSSCMPNLQRIQLDRNERPKGLSFLTDKLLLLLVGKQKFTDPTFIPSSNSDRYIIRLLMKELVSGKDSSSKPGTSQTLSFTFEPSVVSLPEKRSHFKNFASGDCIVEQELSRPVNTFIQSPSRRKHKLEVKSPNYEQTSPSNVCVFYEKGALRNSSVLETLEAEPINRSVAFFGAETATRFSDTSASSKVAQKSLNSPKNNILDNDKRATEISMNLERWYSSFSDLHLRLLELIENTKNGRRFSLVYPSSQEPPFICIKYQKRSSNAAIVEETRNVLLYNGKIHLHLVQQLFDLHIVEMKHGPSWIVLTADGEGFIPVAFKAKQEIIIRDGKDNFDPQESYAFKYLRNLDPNSAYYDPKTRAMRENPYANAGKNPDEVSYAGDNFVRYTGATISMAQTQLFAWEAYEKGSEVHLQADPTKLELLYKSFKVKKEDFKQQQKESILEKYGGQEHLDAPPPELLLAQTEDYVEYSRHGTVIKGQEKAVARSKYEEDVMINNHTCIWGSYWKEGRWGYKCCYSFVKFSYCTGEAGKEIANASEELLTEVHEDEQLTKPKTLVEIHQQKQKEEKRKKKKKHKKSTSSDSEGEERKKQEKLKKALNAEEARLLHVKEIMQLDERKRPYNIMYENREPTEEEMEAYQMKRQRPDDPMASFLGQ